MGDFRIREWEPTDRPVASRILDAALGAGFWDGGEFEREMTLVAESDGVVIGVASAGLDMLEGEPVGHIRLVAVDREWRRRGVASTLVRELIERCERLGARHHLTYAWVHGPGGAAPIANVLVSVGFSFVHRIEGFYSGFDGSQCPACGHSPCGCAADLYMRERSSARS